MQTLRFWHFHKGSPVKLSLRDGETLQHSYGGLTDDGWYRQTDTWSRDGDFVTSEYCADGVDCDGRLTRYGESLFHVSERAEFVDSETGLKLPLWRHCKSRQRDYSAESMNY